MGQGGGCIVAGRGLYCGKAAAVMLRSHCFIRLASDYRKKEETETKHRQQPNLLQEMTAP